MPGLRFRVKKVSSFLHDLNRYADLVEKRGLGVYGRNVTIPKAKGRACQFTFSDLCEQVSLFSYGTTVRDTGLTDSHLVQLIISRSLRNTLPSLSTRSRFFSSRTRMKPGD